MFELTRRNLFLLISSVALLVIPRIASATVLTFGLDIEFSGGTPPAGTTPWITATFDDGGTAGTVDLTLSSAGLVGVEFIDEWLFNLNPLQSGLLPLSIAQNPGGPTAGITQGTNAFKADGDGFYDIRFDFAAGPPTSRFNKLLIATFSINDGGANILTASSFDFFDSGGAKGDFKSAAHVQGIAPEGNKSGWIGTGTPIPEPSTLLMLGSGLLAIGVFARLKRHDRKVDL